MIRSRSRPAVHIRTPSECTPEELQAFQELVSRGQQVAAAGLITRLVKAHWLGFYYEDSKLMAVAGLKQPERRYRDRVFQRADAEVEANRFDTELGWVYTCEQLRGRGIARRLLLRLLRKVGQKHVYATTSAENVRMRSLLDSLGFHRIGKTFEGASAHRQLELWIRQPRRAHNHLL